MIYITSAKEETKAEKCPFCEKFIDVDKKQDHMKDESHTSQMKNFIQEAEAVIKIENPSSREIETQEEIKEILRWRY